MEDEQMVVQPKLRTNDVDNVYGTGWRAARTGDGIILRYMTGALNGSVNQFTINEEEFERLRADPAQFLPIIYAHGG